jgi:hypothetical protein
LWCKHFEVDATILFIGGLTRSMQFTALSTLVFADVPEDRMSGANTLFSMVQQMTTGMGVALGTVMLRLASLFDPGARDVIPIANFHNAFVAIGVVPLLGLFDLSGLNAAAGDEVRQRRAQAKRSGQKLGAN